MPRSASLRWFRVMTLCGCWAGLASPVMAQRDKGPDRRDRITLKSGKVLTGRVLNPFHADELVLRIGGKRKRVARRSVRDIHTINADIAQFLAHRKKAMGQPKRAWFVAEWARSRKLYSLARAQAYAVVLDQPKHRAAHEFLGHRKRGEEWRWRVGGRFVSQTKFEEHHRKWGSALSLRGEHFEVKTTAGVRHAVNMVFDLEAFYLFFREQFGAQLDLHEVLEPIRIQAWRSFYDFPGLSNRKLPYYDLRSDVANTYFHPDKKRPNRMFGVATQALIYASLVGERGSVVGNHLCAWAEVGLGEWAENAFGGKAGQAAPKKGRLDTLVASTVLRLRPKLKFVTHLQYRLFHEASPRVDLCWDASSALVHFLMGEGQKPPLQARFMAYLRLAFRKGLGGSSSAFDKAMGRDIEQLDREFRRWLAARK